MFSSLRARLWLTYVMVICVVLGLIGFWLVFFLLRNPLATRETLLRLRILSTGVLERSAGLGDLSLDRLRSAVERADQAYDVRVVILDPDGKVWVDSRVKSAAPLPKLPVLAVGDKSLNRQWFRDADGKVWLYQLRPVKDGYTLLLAAPRPPISWQMVLRDEILRPFLEAGLIALALSLILAVWVARWVASPLQHLAQGARAVVAGEYRKIPMEGPKEVQDVSRAFNDMLARVQTSQQAQRDFVANVSHELKTPLTSIQGFAQAILDGAAETPEALQQAVRVIHSEAERMTHMVLDLLDLARLDSRTAAFRRDPVDLAALLSGVIEKVSPLASEAQVMLQAQIEHLPAMIGDADRLAQVFSNLLDNALKHSPAGGQVTLRARPEDRVVRIQVEDSGPGIPAEDLERIFERFYQVDKSRRGGRRRGAGLGLAIAREIVQAHQGKIFAENQPGQGCVFTVTLPLA